MNKEHTTNKKSDIIATIFTILIVTLNLLIASINASTNLTDGSNKNGELLGYLIGAILFVPGVILLISSIWKRNRTRKRRVNIIIIGFIINLFIQLVVFIVN